jgi:hypothetical protein
LFTLALIKNNTSIGTIEGFFRRKGAEEFLMYHDLELGTIAINVLKWL